MVRALVERGRRVLVVDDNSPDGTGEIADRLAAELDARRRAPPRAQGGARAGVPRRLSTRARRRSRAVLEMDCDFSHDPDDVPRLIAAAEDGADLVLGSRYVPGGSIPNWSLAAAVHLARRLRLRAALAADAAARPHRRVQVLPARGARDDRPRRDRVEGLRVPDRGDVPRRCARASASSRSRSRSSTARRADRRCRARSCSRRSGRCPRSAFAALAGRL